jgi:peptidoglycan/xylan/chitin deacetylase (PgdA/CDA1 family)
MKRSIASYGRTLKLGLGLAITLAALRFDTREDIARALGSDEAERGYELPRLAAPIRMAITFDDLPRTGVPVAGYTSAQIMDSLRITLKKHAVEEAVGFFTGANLDGSPEEAASLRAFCEDGHLLANHTFAHIGARLVTSRAFTADIAKNQALLERLVGEPCADSRYFRFPGLVRGAGPEARATRRFLADEGYRIADVSIDHADWSLADAWARCTNQRNTHLSKALALTYIDNALGELHWSVDTARRLYGRSIPHVFLVHANPLTAHLLDALLTAYEKAGVQFIALEEALADPAYAEEDSDAHGDGKLLEAAIHKRGLSGLRHLPEPLALFEAICTE